MTFIRGIAIFMAAALLCGTQIRPPEEPRLPDGKSQKEAILKAEHEKNLKDAAELLSLSEELKAELEKKEQELVREIRRKVERQSDRLNRLGVGGGDPLIVPNRTEAPAFTPAAPVVPTVGSS